jgi:hypothetical protein
MLMHMLSYLDGYYARIGRENGPKASVPDQHIIKANTGRNDYTIQKGLDLGFHVIMLYRDGRDVIVSTYGKVQKPHRISVGKWLINIKQILEYKNHSRCLPVQYEALVTNPDVEMDRIANFLHTKIVGNFRDFYKKTNSHSHMMRALDNMGAQPLTTDRIGNWKKSRFDKFWRVSFRKYPETMDQFCDYLIKLGYEKDRKWTDEYRKL